MISDILNSVFAEGKIEFIEIDLKENEIQNINHNYTIACGFVNNV